MNSVDIGMPPLNLVDVVFRFGSAGGRKRNVGAPYATGEKMLAIFWRLSHKKLLWELHFKRCKCLMLFFQKQKVGQKKPSALWRVWGKNKWSLPILSSHQPWSGQKESILLTSFWRMVLLLLLEHPCDKVEKSEVFFDMNYLGVSKNRGTPKCDGL